MTKKMPLIEIRQGSDWVQVLLDGQEAHAHHEWPLHEMAEFLVKLGFRVEMPDGDFCEDCTEWHHDLGNVCEACAAIREEDDPE